MTEKKNKEHVEVSRREFLKDAGLLAGGAAIGSTVLMAACGGEETTKTETKTMTETVTETTTAAGNGGAMELVIHEPTGEAAGEITALHAERLDTLDGKTIALMACAPYKWQPHRILPYIAEKIKERYPTATFIPQTEFTEGTGINSAEDAQKVVDAGADAMIDAFAA
jgi:hypothetical protein